MRGDGPSDRLRSDVDAEVRFHLEARVEELTGQGMSAEDARSQAMVEFGDLDHFREELLAIDRRRAAARRRAEFLDLFRRHGKLSIRRLLREPAFSVPALGTLAIGFGAAAAIFALVRGVLLAPLPYAEPDRLVVVRNSASGRAERGLSEGVYAHFHGQSEVFEDLAAYFDRTLSVTDGDVPERIRSALVTPNLFGLLGVSAQAGRTCRPGDEEAEPLRVVISDGFWKRRFGSDPSIVGTTVELNRRAREIVGVMPTDFAFPAAETELWLCIPTNDTVADIDQFYEIGVGRLRAGITPEIATADLQRLIPLLAESYPDVTAAEIAAADLRAHVVPLSEDLVRDVKPALLLLAGAGALILLLAWANASNLVLLRADRRGHETAVSRALGAGYKELAAQAVVESMVLSTCAGVLALAFATIAAAAGFGLAQARIPRLHEVGLDAVTVVTLAGCALFTGLALGFLSTASSGRDVVASLRSGTTRSGGRPASQRVQRTLVALQVTVAFTLAVAALSMIESARRMQEFRPGFDPIGAVSFEIALPAGPYAEVEQRFAFLNDLVARLEAVPGVTSAGATFNLPLNPIAFSDEPVTVDPNEGPPVAAVANAVTPEYFRSMGMQLRAGRGFVAREALAADRPVVVSAALATLLFGSEDVVGSTVYRADAGGEAFHKIVGVVENVPGEKLIDAPAPLIYFPWLGAAPTSPEERQAVPLWPNEWMVVVRGDLLPSELIAAARSIVAQLDPQVPLGSPGTLEDLVYRSSVRTRLTAQLLAVAATVALLLAAVGLYGVVSYTVSRRVHEFGVRFALGARSADVHRLVAGESARLTALGIAAGAAIGAVLLRGFEDLLFQVSATEPILLAVAGLFLLCVAVTATWSPARRAASIDPRRALDTG